MKRIIIGKKELFAFAERYAGQKVKDFKALEDGEVVALLLSRIFPSYRIVPAPHRTYSFSQRSQYNWEHIFRLCARVHIPLVLIHFPSFGNGVNFGDSHSNEGEFSTVALLYFLFHLSKRLDFSAEFSEDVSEELMEYLQSLDSIASLLLGGALDWEGIPVEVEKQIKSFPAFHSTPEEVALAEKEAVRLCRSFLGMRNRITPPETNVEIKESTSEREAKDNCTKNHYKSEDYEQKKSNLQSSSRMSQQRSALNALPTSSGTSAEKVSSTSFSSLCPPTNNSPASEKTAFFSTTSTEVLSSAWERERELLHQLALKTEECEQLHCREINWIEKIRTLSLSCGASQNSTEKHTVDSPNQSIHSTKVNPEEKNSSEYYRLLYESEKDKRETLEGQLHTMLHLKDIQNNKTSQNSLSSPLTTVSSGEIQSVGVSKNTEGLLGDVRDPDSHQLIYPHSVAHTLYEWILDISLTGSKSDETRMTLLSLIRSLWTAYSVLEHRLIVAVDLLETRAEGFDVEAEGKLSLVSIENRRHASSLSIPFLNASTIHKMKHHNDDVVATTCKSHQNFDEILVRNELKDLQKRVHELFTTSCRREEQWRILCGKLYQAEKRANILAERMSMQKILKEEIEEAASVRSRYFDEIEHLSDQLLPLPSPHSSNRRENESFLSSIHEAMSCLDESFSQLREALRLRE